MYKEALKPKFSPKMDGGASQVPFERDKASSTLRGKGESKRQTSESTAASTLAGMLLEENARKGKTITIPSLGIILSKDNLRNTSK